MKKLNKSKNKSTPAAAAAAGIGLPLNIKPGVNGFDYYLRHQTLNGLAEEEEEEEEDVSVVGWLSVVVE
ncbi:hypothetical protein Pmani_023693 [Petrolisthes manimaculis]|uniref:Uncharacterized protein n=1 Tax=Petrolisthes manimaculis TaxID=1843537 RepID=A0AAE1P923_9EUCA|nr:hypothetical protein Pmani_023693 [Petrolisthes manimaculis]